MSRVGLCQLVLVAVILDWFTQIKLVLVTVCALLRHRGDWTRNPQKSMDKCADWPGQVQIGGTCQELLEAGRPVFAWVLIGS